MSSLHSILTLFFSLSTTTPNSYTLSLHDALPILWRGRPWEQAVVYELHTGTFSDSGTYEGIERRLDYLADLGRSEEHTSELQSRGHLVCRLLFEKNKKYIKITLYQDK